MAKGGARAGAGRKPKPKIPFIAKKDAESVLDLLGKEIELPTTDGGKRKQKLPTRKELWITLILAADLRVRLQALCALEDREYGKPAQRVETALSGKIQHDHTDLSRLTDEQLAQVESIIESAVAGSD